MRLLLNVATAGLLAVAATATASAAPDLDHWFLSATHFNALTTATSIAHPDFLGGTSLKMQCRFAYNGKLPSFQGGIWQLVRYDRTHHIALAMASTDQNSCALFSAPPPGVSAPDADLSTYGTGKGLKIGSPAAQVFALYGGARKNASHFVTAYIADVPDVSVTGKPVKLPETITIAVDGGAVSAITIVIEMGGMY